MKKPQHLKIKGIDNSWADLSRWLIKGSNKTDARWFYREATGATWEKIIVDRLPFVEAAKDYFSLMQTRGAARSSITTSVSYMNSFVRWVDDNNLHLSLDDKLLEAIFLRYDEYCYFRAWSKKEVLPLTSYNAIWQVAQSLSNMLGRSMHAELRHHSRVIKAHINSSKTSVSRSAEKQHFGDTKALGYYCVDICDAITIEAVYGQLPLAINTLRPDGTQRVIEMPMGLINKLNHEKEAISNWAKKICKPTSELKQNRSVLIRIRLLAELMIFVYQTGLSVSQTLKIERKGFRYNLQGSDDWQVRCHKGRKQGPISFTIYKEYKDRFKSLIKFVDHFYPDGNHLFPVTTDKAKIRGSVCYRCLKNHAKRDGIPWIPPRVTRNTRVNFLDRICGNAGLSDEINQHSREAFRQHYERPSQQRAMNELTKFWDKAPVSLINGGCQSQPKSTKDKPSGVIAPNCVNESGCLWCSNHRDIESFDYVWSLASFRHLKLIEAAQPLKRKIPADQVIERLSLKLEAFRVRDERSRKWVDEALARVQESNFHSTWKSIINFWEPK